MSILNAVSVVCSSIERIHNLIIVICHEIIMFMRLNFQYINVKVIYGWLLETENFVVKIDLHSPITMTTAEKLFSLT